MPNKYKIVSSWDEIKEVVKYCKQTGYCSHDFETNGESFSSSTSFPTIIGISFQPGSSYIIPLGHKDSIFKNQYKKILKYLNDELFSNPQIVKIAWNVAFEHKWLLKYSLDYQGKFWDGMLAKYLLNEERPNDLKSMVRKTFPEFANYEDGVDKIATRLGWANVPLDILSEYCALDCDLTLRLMLLYEEKLIQHKFYSLFRNLIVPARRVLDECEFRGIDVDAPYLDKLVKDFGNQIEENEIKLRNHKAVRRYNRRRIDERKLALIESVKREIEELEESDKPNKDRLIKTREEKISKYLTGEFVTKKDKKIIEPINFNAPGQLIDFFFKNKHGLRLKIVKYTVDKRTKRPTTTPSTDEEVLELLKQTDKSGFMVQLLHHRYLTKLYSTYMVGIQNKLSENNRIHTSFLIHGTVTGRLSSREPNLQNIPRDTTASMIKKMFIAPKGYSILQVDYSQAELRVMAAVAKEETMLEWFRTGKDIHLAVACKKYKADYDRIEKILDDESNEEHKLWKKRRKQAKTINFGIIYCNGAKKLSQSLSEGGDIVTEHEAQLFLDDFDRLFPKIKQYIQKCKSKVKKNGYMRTLFGRKRRLTDIYSPQGFKRAEAERQSVNAPIQGTASDYALFSSVLIREEKEKGKLPKTMEEIFTVHDSLGFVIKDEDIAKAVPVIRKICENPQTKRWFGFELTTVSMKVDFEIGKTWVDLHKYKEAA